MLIFFRVYPKICVFSPTFDADVDARMKSSESPKVCRTPRGGPWKMAEILWHFFGLCSFPIELQIEVIFIAFF